MFLTPSDNVHAVHRNEPADAHNVRNDRVRLEGFDHEEEKCAHEEVLEQRRDNRAKKLQKQARINNKEHSKIVINIWAYVILNVLAIEQDEDMRGHHGQLFAHVNASFDGPDPMRIN